MSAAQKIPVTVVTGFFGRRQTSLIRHLLQNPRGKKLALIINEFGDLGVDGDILKGCGDETCSEDDVMELTNGCLCCTVADDFIPTLETLLDRDDRPDHIVIETSGLALPKPLVQAFQWPEVRSRTTVDGVVVVVDGPAVKAGLFADDPDLVAAQREADESLDHESPLEELFEDQLACADLVVISKSDLMTGDERQGVMNIVRKETRASVKILSAAHGQIDPALLLGMRAAVEDDLDGRKSHHDGLDGEHDHDDFDSIVVTVGPVDDQDTIKQRVANTLAQDGVLRVKGVIDVAGKPARLVVQGVGPRVDCYFDRPWAEGELRQSRLVVIGLDDFDRAAAEAALKPPV